MTQPFAGRGARLCSLRQPAAAIFAMSPTSRATDSAPDPALSSSAQDNLEAIAELAEKEDANVSPLRAFIERISGFFGTPGYFVFVLLFIVGWIGLRDRAQGDQGARARRRIPARAIVAERHGNR
jgi:hypothetical protein